MSKHVCTLVLISKCILASSKIMSTFSNVDIDIVLTFKYHFCLLKMEHYQSGADSYLIQIFKWTLESPWEIIVGNSLFRAVFTTLVMFSPN